LRRAAAVDRNQPEIVKGLRKFGATVLIVSQLKNCFDILVGYNGINYIVEIKDNLLPPSRKRLTPGELKFKDSWNGGEYYKIETLEEIIKIINK
jgi:hypothetical protein